jgi:hypothetical protein
MLQQLLQVARIPKVQIENEMVAVGQFCKKEGWFVVEKIVLILVCILKTSLNMYLAERARHISSSLTELLWESLMKP